jgi:hypothetical protein
MKMLRFHFLMPVPEPAVGFLFFHFRFISEKNPVLRTVFSYSALRAQKGTRNAFCHHALAEPERSAYGPHEWSGAEP